MYCLRDYIANFTIFWPTGIAVRYRSSWTEMTWCWNLGACMAHILWPFKTLWQKGENALSRMVVIWSGNTPLHDVYLTTLQHCASTSNFMCCFSLLTSWWCGVMCCWDMSVRAGAYAWTEWTFLRSGYHLAPRRGYVYSKRYYFQYLVATLERSLAA